MARDNDIKDIRSVLSNMEKKLGEGIVSKKIEGIERSSSGSISLDIALGGGYAKGRIIEIFGWESSGKTTLALHAVAEIQKNGGRAGYVDTEHALDIFYASDIGVDSDIEAEDPKFVLSQPDNGEQALAATREMLDCGLFDILVVDSVAGLVPKALLQGDVGDQKMAHVARLMSQWIGAFASSVKKNNCILIFINQLREKVGIAFGNPVTTTGGNALKFFSSQRVEVSRIGQIKEGEEIIGNRTRAKIIKNKVSPPFRVAEFDIVYGQGACRYRGLFDVAVDVGIIKRSGSWFSYNDIKLGQGKNAALGLIMDNDELFGEITEKTKKECGLL